MAVGVGAGIGAIFKAPLGGAVLAAEILYIRDFEVEALIPGFIASVIGYSIFATYAGWDPVFGNVADLEFERAGVAGLVRAAGARGRGSSGSLYVKFVLRHARLLQDSCISRPTSSRRSARLGVGLIGVAYPEALSMGYGWLQFAIEGNTAELAVKHNGALIGAEARRDLADDRFGRQRRRLRAGAVHRRHAGRRDVARAARPRGLDAGHSRRRS